MYIDMFIEIELQLKTFVSVRPQNAIFTFVFL